MKNRDRKRAEQAAAAGLEVRSTDAVQSGGGPASATRERSADASPPAPREKPGAGPAVSPRERQERKPARSKSARAAATAPSRVAAKPVQTAGARPFLTAMAVWFVLACIAGASGGVARLNPPMPQVLIGVLTFALIFAGGLHPGLRAWLSKVNLRGFVAFHLVRFVGIVFLVMYSRGELVGEFAIVAGWGDIVTAAGALGLVLFMSNPESRPWLLMLWNAFGLADILTVVYTATRIALSSPMDMAPLLRFPMSLVPTFVVPILIASHVLVFMRLRRLRMRDLDPGAK